MRYDRRKRRIVLDPSHDEWANYMHFDETDCCLEYLDPDTPARSWSPNGAVFRLLDLQEEQCRGVIKFCPSLCSSGGRSDRKRLDRFEREIEALERAKTASHSSHVIEILGQGTEKLSTSKGETGEFRYYVMEEGECDLGAFLLNNDLSLPEKYRICHEIIACVASLHAAGIYHRDIKPSNFLMIGNSWKIADLGLAAFRDRDASALDGERERIGPRGYLSPEAINKWLGIRHPPPTIDDKSDVFQIARLIGFVLQGELPSGIVDKTDFVAADTSGALCSILSAAMQYGKARRSTVTQLRDSFGQAFGKMYAFA